MHVPATEKQPVARFTPLLNVDVPPVRLSCAAESPAAKVLVPCPAPTVMAEAKVLVAAPVTARLLRVAFVATRLVLNKLVVVALVPVASAKSKFAKWEVELA